MICSQNVEVSKGRIGSVECYRFLFSLFIMMHHIYAFGIKKGTYPFHFAWIYVEFFFMLSGYFTVRHLMKRNSMDIRDNIKYCISYTIRKFKAIFPYSTLAIFLTYTVDLISGEIKGERFFLNWIENMICEILLLSSSGLVEAKLAPVWYLSAMFLVFPIFCYLFLCEKSKWLSLYILSWLLPVLYYGKIGIVSNRLWPHDLLRAFVCLMLGAFVYIISIYLENYSYGKKSNLIFTLFEIASLIGVIILTAFNTRNAKLVLIFFTIILVVTFSKKSYISEISWGASVLGKLSLPLYLFHWPVLMYVQTLAPGLRLRYKVIIMYGVTFLISVLIVTICSVKKNKTKSVLR